MKKKTETLRNFIHQATVRRDRVAKLILEMKKLGHRAYMHLNEDAVRAKAINLPEHGIPPELVHVLPNDDSLDKLQVQKAATPVDGRQKIETDADMEKAQEYFKDQIPNAVVMERSSKEAVDLNELMLDGVRNFAGKLDRAAAESAQQDFLNPEQKVRTRQARQRRKLQVYLTSAAYFNIYQLLTPYVEAKDYRQMSQAASSHANLRWIENVDDEEWRSKRVDLAELLTANKAHLHQFIMSTGSGMMNQFEPWYFGVAFAFCFKYCTGMPDMPKWSKHPRQRRHEGDPEVDLATWVKTISRRPELQLKNNWLLGFTMSSVLFRSMLNRARSLHAYTTQRRGDGKQGFTAQELEDGAISICRALDGEYKDLANPKKRHKVNGDLTKVKWATCLTEAGHKLLQNLELVTSQIPGTMEIRKIMRYATHAGRIRRGVPIFVTWSPDEKHNVLMLRLSRARRNDPLRQENRNSANTKSRMTQNALQIGELYKPSITNDDVELRLRRQDILDLLPTYDERRTILARDGLASVEGFRLAVLLTCEYLFGMRVCIDCPHCNHCNHGDGTLQDGCSDLFGSNAYPEGGIHGRADGIFISVEAQKSTGGLHAHAQVHVQCIHQHTPLAEILETLMHKDTNLVRDYLSYKAHVCRQEYDDLPGWRSRQQQTEEDWPEYEKKTESSCRPSGACSK